MRGQDLPRTLGHRALAHPTSLRARCLRCRLQAAARARIGGWHRACVAAPHAAKALWKAAGLHCQRGCAGSCSKRNGVGAAHRRACWPPDARFAGGVCGKVGVGQRGIAGGANGAVAVQLVAVKAAHLLAGGLVGVTQANLHVV